MEIEKADRKYPYQKEIGIVLCCTAVCASRLYTNWSSTDLGLNLCENLVISNPRVHLSTEFSAELGWGITQIEFKSIDIALCNSIFDSKHFITFVYYWRSQQLKKYPFCCLHPGKKPSPLGKRSRRYVFCLLLKIFSVENLKFKGFNRKISFQLNT